MVKSIVVGASFVFCACIADSSEQVESNVSELVCRVSRNERNNPDAYNRCCVGTEDYCSNGGDRIYGSKIGEYLLQRAFSNGECTNGPSGLYQCVHYAKDVFWHNALKFDKGWWSESWRYAARGLIVARSTIDNGQNLFVFDNGSNELPRETDMIIFQSIDRNGNLLAPSDSRPGHVSIVSGVHRENGVIYLDLIEENFVDANSCDQNLNDAVMRSVTVSENNGHYTVNSGSRSLRAIGWIRHPLAGIYGDTGWHDEDGMSQAFRSVYERWDNDFVGWARDNGGTPFVHTRNGHILQDFVTANGSGRALVYNPDPNLRKALLVRDGFYSIYLGMEGRTGLPLDEEHLGSCLSVQNFENGSMCWNGFVAIWLEDNSTPPPLVEAGSSDSGSDAPAECYDGDWMPCYTDSVSTQNVGVCRGGRVLCSGGHWQWNICDGEITPSTENCADSLDNDCDALVDCGDTSCAGTANCPADVGGGADVPNCDADGDGYIAISCGGNDCNDADSSIHPGAVEALWFDWIDSDCNGRDAPDADGDLSVTMEDCDDLDALQHPGATEVCNGEDDDCDGIIDEDACPRDTDNDGSLDATDCAPSDPTIFPGAPETCNGADDNCDGVIDEGVLNRCGSCGPEPDERCSDNIDNDCDGIIDELNVCPLPDFDHDGILDVFDNCPDTYNEGQSDIDGDGVGDACDPHDDRVFPPEICDGVDNDLDGLADDGYECVLNSWGDCLTECGSSGRQHCAGNCVWSVCNPPAEICWNGIDDDCDSYESEDCGAIAGAWCYSANLTSNSSFESSLNGWTLDVSGNASAEMLEDCSTAQDGECNLRVVTSRQGGWSDVVLGTTLNLVSGSEYQIRLYTRKRDPNAGDAPQVLISSGNSMENVGVWSQCTVMDSWNQCAIRFRARDSASGYRLLILLGRISGEVLLDDVRVLSCG